MVIPGWIAVAVWISATAPNIHVDTFKTPLTDKTVCEGVLKEVEVLMAEDKTIVAYGLSCTEVMVDDHDTSDDPRSKAKPVDNGPKKK
jgi:hypothetical protein